MTLLEQIRAEIERRMDKHWEGLPDADSPEDDWTHNELCELGAYKELEHLESFLDTLQEQEPQGLDEAAENWCKENCDGFVLRDKTSRYVGDGIDAFKAGAEWRDKQIPKLPDDLEEAANTIPLKLLTENKESYTFDSTGMRFPKDCFKAGAKWMARQGETKEQVVFEANPRGIPSVPMVLSSVDTFKLDDKVIVQIRQKDE